MSKQKIAKAYIEFLSKGDAASIIRLFAVSGAVHSPIYGLKSAAAFYQDLFKDTSQSELVIKGIFEEADKNQLALYFEYKWTLKSGKQVVFDVVDILEFDEDLKIQKLTIIYDTVRSRKLVEELN